MSVTGSVSPAPLPRLHLHAPTPFRPSPSARDLGSARPSPTFQRRSDIPPPSLRRHCRGAPSARHRVCPPLPRSSDGVTPFPLRRHCRAADQAPAEDNGRRLQAPNAFTPSSASAPGECLLQLSSLGL